MREQRDELYLARDCANEIFNADRVSEGNAILIIRSYLAKDRFETQERTRKSMADTVAGVLSGKPL